MIVVWDEPKRILNFAKHGFDFADFEAAFSFSTAVVAVTGSSRTGRRRLTLIGRWNERVIVVAVASPLGSEALSIVSLRPANRTEKDAYERR